MTQRIYVVVDTIANARHLVRAASKAQAIARVARDRLTVSVPSTAQVVELMQGGTIVLDAGDRVTGASAEEATEAEPAGSAS